MSEQSADRTRDEIRPTKRSVEDALLARPGVIGVDIGEKWSGGVPTGRQAIVVHVAAKRGDDELDDAERIPASFAGIPTDVVEHRVSAAVGPAAGSRRDRRGTRHPAADPSAGRRPELRPRGRR